MTETAYSTDNPAAVDAYRAAQTALVASVQRAHADAETLGNNKGPVYWSGITGTCQCAGLAADDPENSPLGWRYSRQSKCLVPGRGKAGEAAKAWVEDHHPTQDSATVLVEFGLPLNDHLGAVGGAQFRLGRPKVFEVDGTLWALYRGTPVADMFSDAVPCTWTPRKLSEFYAAAEAHDEALKAKAAA